MLSVVIVAYLLSRVATQGTVNCSAVQNLSSPTLNLLRVLTTCLVEPGSSANPRYSQYFDINTVPLIVRDTALFGSAPWEAAKFYQPNALGRLSYGLDVPLYRRPSSESTSLNINTAASYAMLRVVDSRYPWAIPYHHHYFSTYLGLDPNDHSSDKTTPVGIGNYVGEGITNYMYNDGMNQLGELDCDWYNSGTTYHRHHNRMNFSDYTCYEPRNTAERFRHRNSWQPAFDFLDNVTWVVQKFAMPQAENIPTYSGTNMKHLADLLPGPYLWPSIEYAVQAQQVIDISATLNDTQKMLAEFFNNKTQTLINPTAFLVLQELSLGHIHHPPVAIMKSVAIATAAYLDALIFSWTAKNKFDAPRPFSAVKFLYDHETILAWSQNQGTKHMKGREWEPYLRTGPFSEYTSTTTCLNYALLQVFYRLRGNYTSGWNFPVQFTQGSSTVEPGITPASNITIVFATLDDMKLVASESREWGGVHFKAASEHPRPLCETIGDNVFLQWVREMNGDPILDGA